MKRFLLSVIDWFYPPFRRIMPIQTFRYAACGGGNTVLDIFIFWFSYKHILHETVVIHLPFYTLSTGSTAQLMAFCVSFPTGFFLMRNLVFPESNLRGRVQLFRYLLLVVVCLFLNLILIKFFSDFCHVWPPFAKVLATVFVVTFSYLTQKHFTFGVKRTPSA
jgi:putative flippase GtrA